MQNEKRYQILTPTGFRDFDGVHRSFRQSVIVRFTDDSELHASTSHVLVTPKGDLGVTKLRPNLTIFGKRVVSVSLGKIEVMYDPLNVDGGNVYLSEDMVHHNCQFHGSSDTLISGSKLQKLVPMRPTKTDEKENLQIYEDVQEGRSYVITVDTSEGVGGDSSVCSVFDVSTQPYRHVAKYRSNVIPPLMFARIAFDMGMHFNNALLVVESNNSSGAIVVNHLWYDLEYDNMLTTRTKEGENKISGAARSQPGVRTTVRTKSLGCSNLKAMIESDLLITNDFDTIQELSTFCAKGKSYEASSGKNDDCVMTLVLFSWFANEPYFAEMVDADIKGILSARLAEQEEFQMLTVFFDDGLEEEHVQTF